jgi:hypothetical protein
MSLHLVKRFRKKIKKINLTDCNLITSKMIYPELEFINESVFKNCGLEVTNIEVELESQEYFAHNFLLDKLNVKFRTAKITPTKTGQFVTIWKRNEKGITTPFDISDNIDFYIIATRKDTNFGIFIFPKAALHEHKILSDKTKDGKRGIRVYPSWDLTTNKQATKTQSWQTKYFLDICQDNKIDIKRAKKLLNFDKKTIKDIENS